MEDDEEMVLENMGVVRLGGFAGSDPEILELISELSPSDREQFIAKSLPPGMEPGQFTVNKLGDLVLMSYSIKIKAEQEGVRDDLASISIVVSDKKVNVDQFEKLFLAITETFKDNMEALTAPFLKRLIERLYNGLNKNKKIAVDTVSIDIPGIVKKNKLDIKKKTLSDFKGAF